VLKSLLPTTQTSDPLWVWCVDSVIDAVTVDTPKGPLPVQRYDEWMEVMYAEEPVVLPIAGEGSGKSLHAGLWLSAGQLYDSRHGNYLYWVVGADFEDARKDFDYYVMVQEQLDNVETLSHPASRDQQCYLRTKTGHETYTISSYDVTKIARDEPMRIVGAEVSRWYQETFERCEGRLIRNYPHSRAFMSGSPESSLGWLPDIAKYSEGPNERGVRSFKIPSWCNLAKYPGGRQDKAILRAEAGRSPQKFAERFGAAFVPPKGLVCHTFRTNLHVDTMLEYNPELPVYVGIDPGGVTYAVLFVQFTYDGEIHVLDQIYVHRWPHSAVINEYLANELSAVVQGGAIDVASKQPQNAMPVSYSEWFNDTGLNLWAEKHAVDDSVERLYWALAPNPNTGRPRLRIHPQCTGLIAEMGGGPSPVPDGGPWMRYETKGGIGTPKRENDHACKALAYLLLGPYAYMGESTFHGQQDAVSYLARPSFGNWDSDELN
jgi:hypothetical protein